MSMMEQEEFELGDRLAIGANGGPSIDRSEFDPDFISARIIKEAAEYIQFRFHGLEQLLEKRRGKRPMGFRLILSYAIRGLVPSETAARILGFNRKTYGENQHRAEVWANHDSEEGREFDALIEHVTEAVHHHVLINVPEVMRLVDHFVEIDPSLRKLEKQAAAAALAADRAAAAHKEKAEAKRIRSVGSMRSKLKGATNSEAILAQHKGPTHTAKNISPEALATVDALIRADQKGARRLTSELNPEGLKECLRFGLAADAEPSLSTAKDRKIRPTDFAHRVWLEAIGQDLIKKPKRKAARA